MVIFMIIIETLNIYIYACFCRYSFNNRKWESEKINNHPKWYYLFTLLSGFRDSNGTPLQYSCLENAMDGEAWWAAVHGVAESRTRLNDFTFTFHFYALEKEMATHSSVLAWKIPGPGKPGGLLSMGSQSRTRLKRLSSSSSCQG